MSLLLPPDKVYAFTLENERGYTVDAGGPTQDGVTQRDYDAYRQKLGLYTWDVRNISDGERREIYAWWWKSPYFDQLNLTVATKLFDLCFNTSSPEGKSTGIEILQRALQHVCVGPVVVDGVFGPETIRFANAIDYDVLYDYLVTEWIMHYVGLVQENPSDGVNLRGWIRRAARLVLS